MFALVFEESELLDDVVVCARGSFLLPTWNVDLVLPLLVGADLEVVVETRWVTAVLVAVWHSKYPFIYEKYKK